MTLPIENIQNAAAIIYKYMQPSPQYAWPLLQEFMGHEIWVKHENHNPTGAFKIRGGLLYLHELALNRNANKKLVSATRGNHGQSIANAAKIFGFETDIFVPKCNCCEKNQSMSAYGAKLHECGEDFDASRDAALEFADNYGAHFVKPYNDILVNGVATYGLELLSANPDLDRVYVPIGSGSGICGLIAARDALKLKTEIIGVVSDNANAYKLSFESGKITSTESANTFADGIAVRTPNPQAFEIIKNGAAQIISVSDAQIMQAINILFQTTKNIAEGAGAAALAGAIAHKETNKGRKVAIILSGGNISKKSFIDIINQGERIN